MNFYIGSPTIFEDKLKVLEFMKKYKDARFKSFPSKLHAIDFSLNGPAFDITSPVKSENLENLAEKSMFNSLKPQELSKLRKAIERGDIDFFKQCVELNPRYLISTSDTAVIVQEGCRYNSLHVAVKSNKLEICYLILDTIQNPDFIHSMFPRDPAFTQVQRMKLLLHSYLNTPDKGANETPLHFAAKFGHLEIIRLLTSHPACDKDRINKFEQKPCDVRKHFIFKQFSQYYVSLLRPEDDTVPAMVGKPWSPDVQQEPIFEAKTKMSSPCDPNMSITAFIGPMSPNQFMSPRNLNDSVVSPLMKLRFSDFGKGYERFGRNIAKEEDVPWTEYWSFLSCYCDLASNEGLAKLEAHLKHNFEVSDFINLKKSSHDISLQHSKSVESVFTPITQLCQDFKNLHLESLLKLEKASLNQTIELGHDSIIASDKAVRKIDFDRELDEDYDIHPDVQADYENILELTGHHIAKALLEASGSLLSDDTNFMKENLLNAYHSYFTHIQKFVNENRNRNFSHVHLHNAVIVYQDVRDVLTANDLILFSNVFSDHSMQCNSNELQSMLISHFACILKIVTNKFIMKQEITQCSCSWNQINSSQMGTTEQLSCKCDYDSSDSDSDSFFTPPTSPKNIDDSPRAHTPPIAPLVFINGTCPSKGDLDAFRAIEDLEISQIQYPYICYWKTLMNGYSFEEKEKFKYSAPQILTDFIDFERLLWCVRSRSGEGVVGGQWNNSSYGSTPKKTRTGNSILIQSPQNQFESPKMSSSPTSYLLTRNRLFPQL
ncbi:Ankyrin repeat and LEM domain-containing protein 2 [Nymphon striatum]|nr:Ankyrin repeat and LEM domain-containing protein 2 [Nymphon striatum]